MSNNGYWTFFAWLSDWYSASKLYQSHFDTNTNSPGVRAIQGGPEVTAIGWVSLAWPLLDPERQDWWLWKEEIQNLHKTRKICPDSNYETGFFFWGGGISWVLPLGEFFPNASLQQRPSAGRRVCCIKMHMEDCSYSSFKLKWRRKFPGEPVPRAKTFKNHCFP